MAIYGRDSRGRFISKEKAEREKALVERTKPSAKIVVFRERIKGTRIAQVVRKAFEPETSDSEIQQELQSRYDRGGNYVINIQSIGFGFLKPGDEFIVEVGGPHSADVSP